MSIIFNERNMTFNLKTQGSSYVLGVLKGVHLVNLYYGKRVEKFYDESAEDILPTRRTWHHGVVDIERSFSSSSVSSEYATAGADIRTPPFHAVYENGSSVTIFEYQGYNIYSGKKKLSGLPSSYAEKDSEAETLEITLKDTSTGMTAILSYSVFEEYDIVCRSVKLKNCGKGRVDIKSALSQSAYLFDKDFDFVHLCGGWARERHIERIPLGRANVSIDSKCGISGHNQSPFMALARKNATENEGEVYGFSLCYSGNFIAQAEVNTDDVVRLNMGINPFGFTWELKPGEEFQTPEVVSVYSDKGFGKMSRTYHSFYRTHLVRGKWRDSERPVLINNWEATYFDFDEEKIINIAKKAKEAGVELMVLDDGWFGKRDIDNCSLGDWYEHPKKLPNGVSGLAQAIEDMGMKFGLWFEPEMVSPDSDLYRAHPDWCLHSYDRPRTLGRSQLVLDMSRKDVQDYVVEAVSAILRKAPISYVKWDMNRNLSEIGSAALDAKHQQEVAHRYVLGLYSVLERIMVAFPDVLFEGCCGGGGRFDAGMLYYFPQYWTSDDSDAIERLYIQYGTSMVMPSCTMGAHVSAVPNHQVGRTTPLKSRGDVAMAGQFGYELDLAKLTDEEFEEVKKQIVKYKQIRETVHKGDMYRLKSPFENNFCSWMFVNKDKSEAVVTFATIKGTVRNARCNLKLCGLDENTMYSETETGRTYSGEYLMNVGLFFDNDVDHRTELLKFVKVL